MTVLTEQISDCLLSGTLLEILQAVIEIKKMCNKFLYTKCLLMLPQLILYRLIHDFLLFLHVYVHDHGRNGYTVLDILQGPFTEMGSGTLTKNQVFLKGL